MATGNRKKEKRDNYHSLYKIRIVSALTTGHPTYLKLPKGEKFSPKWEIFMYSTYSTHERTR